MTTAAEHLGHDTGNADQNCGNCTLVRRHPGWFCDGHDLPLRSNQHGAIRCFACIRDHSRNTDKERND